MNVIVCVSDNHLWCLKPFMHLFNKYWSPDQLVEIAGYKPPDFDLLPNFKFYSIAVPQYPKEKWVDGILEFMNLHEGMEQFVLLLEDYWLSRKVDVEAIEKLYSATATDQSILRFDLTADRLYAGGVRDVGCWDRFDIIEAPGSQYQMSLQAGIWNKKPFVDILSRLPRETRSAWDVELSGTSLVNESKYRVYGTRQCPIRYANGMNNAMGHKAIFSGLTMDDINEIMGLIPEENK